MSLTIIIPDVHLPYEDKRAVDNVFEMLAYTEPERVVQIGDLLDMKAPARWSKGRAEEYADNVRGEADAGVQFWARMRDVLPQSELVYIQGNHEDRLRAYAHTYAPAILSIIPSLAELMRLDEFGVRHEKVQPFKLHPKADVIAIHGKLLANYSSLSARKEMIRHGRSIVQGHTHRLGVIYETADRTRFALEAGWLGDIRRAGTYLDYPGVANWQQGFGYTVENGKHVTPGVVPVHDRGRFSFHGRNYG